MNVDYGEDSRAEMHAVAGPGPKFIRSELRIRSKLLRGLRRYDPDGLAETSNSFLEWRRRSGGSHFGIETILIGKII